MMHKSWHARTSSLGGYAACSMRAWLDHAIQAGHVDPKAWGFTDVKATNASSPPADFGTCCHWSTQCGLRTCFKAKDDWNNMQFTGWDDTLALAQKFSQAQWDNGASMFPSDEVARNTMHAVAKNVRDHMPDGITEWISEACFDVTGLLRGHIDFLSSDHSVIVDLKTTGSKPAGGRPKMNHLWQLMGYALGVFHATGTFPSVGYIVYAHNRGDWCFRTKPIDFQSPIVKRMIMSLPSRLSLYADYPALTKAAMPTPGDCCNDFCPYTRVCRDAIIPPGVSVRDVQVHVAMPDAPSTTSIFGDTNE